MGSADLQAGGPSQMASKLHWQMPVGQKPPLSQHTAQRSRHSCMRRYDDTAGQQHKRKMTHTNHSQTRRATHMCAGQVPVPVQHFCISCCHQHIAAAEIQEQQSACRVDQQVACRGEGGTVWE